jgi:hypothetical protein
MFQEPEHYTESDHFFFEFNDELEKVCNAPKDKQGVFKIIELRKGKINGSVALIIFLWQRLES